MTIFGRDQALYKVASKPKPGQPAKEDSYVLGENERQDDIEVVKINRDSNVVTFNNHGTQQEVQLTDAGSSGSAPGPGGRGGPGNGMPPNLRPGAMSPAESAALFRKGVGIGNPQPAGSPGNFNNNGFNNNGSTPGSPGGVPGFSTANASSIPNYAPNQLQNGSEPLTPEQQVMLMEAQRAQSLQQGTPLHKLLPLTPKSGRSIKSLDKVRRYRRGRRSADTLTEILA